MILQRLKMSLKQQRAVKHLLFATVGLPMILAAFGYQLCYLPGPKDTTSDSS